MDKLKMHSPDLSQDNIAKLRELFPGVVTEAKEEQTGELRLVVDFDQLRQELSADVVEGAQERYRLDWPGKREALALANAPIAKTLRPAANESVNFDTTKNIFVEGDNLEALKLLQEIYLGKVKLIYIDPPYNTGNDFIYNDDFTLENARYGVMAGNSDEGGSRLRANGESNGRFHSDWISMMYARLRLARSLLNNLGMIFISIDDGEVANLRKICDEVFGESNFVAQIAWEKRYTRSNNAKRFYSLKDTVLVYRRSEHLDVIKEERTAKADANYSNPDGDPRGPWMTSSYVNPATKEARPNLAYDIKAPDGRTVSHPTHAWKYASEQHDVHVASKRLWWGRDGKAEFPRLKLFLSEQTGGLVPVDIWNYESSGTTDDGGQEVKQLFGASVFDNPKPIKLIRRMIGIATSPDAPDLVMDFFSGSASTAHAVMEANAADGGNRRFIMVQLQEAADPASPGYKAGFATIAEISKERIRRAGDKILTGETHPNWNRDVGFRVLKIDSSNMKDVYYRPDQVDQGSLLDMVDNVKEDRTVEDLLFQVLVDWGVDLSLPIRQEIILGKTVFFVDDTALAACFEQGISEELVKALAERAPLRVVFRDNGFASDALKINVEQIFRQLSPGTEVRAI
ncbi:Type III restriction-modification system methylation subunit [Devosia sp. H5989]|nr:Type III restriction-modification system methylation subunit [Devosia sp. H5989]